MTTVRKYIENIQNLITLIIDTQLDKIDAAGEIVAETIIKQGYVYTFGTGHSHMMAEELFYRAGGLVKVYPIFEEALMLHNGAIKSTEMERLDGYAELIMHRYECSKNDCLIISSNSGRNSVNVEMVNEAHKRGMKVIALTNLNHSKKLKSRHSSGLKLYQIADVVLDNQGCVGDASLYVPQLDMNIAATSTSTGALLLNAVVVSAVEKMVNQGHIPEVLSSSNLDEGDEINNKLLKGIQVFVKPL
jgi:uncharacterized phosphosugar-binding protein